MRCPECGDPETKVIETREAEDAVRRRRQCLAKGHRFTTYERPELAVVTVRSSGGTERSLTRMWLASALGIVVPDVPDTDLQALAAEIEAQLRTGGRRIVSTAEVAATASPLLQLALQRAQGTPPRPSPDQVMTALDARFPRRRASGPAQLALPID